MALAKSTMLPDLMKFAQNIPADKPYHELAPLVRESGWVIRLREVGLTMAGPDVLVSFEVQVGQDAGTLETLDRLTTRVSAIAAHVSLVARVQAEITVIYMLFGRLPPQDVAAARPPMAPPTVPAQPGEMNGHDETEFKQEESWADVEADDGGDGGEYVEEDVFALDVVEKREPDGVPIFVDLYALDERPEELVKAVLEEIEEFLSATSGVEQVDAVARKNPEMLTFLRDLGEPDDIGKLKALVAKRRGQLRGGVVPAKAAAKRRRKPVSRARAH